MYELKEAMNAAVSVLAQSQRKLTNVRETIAATLRQERTAENERLVVQLHDELRVEESIREVAIAQVLARHSAWLEAEMLGAAEGAAR